MSDPIIFTSTSPRFALPMLFAAQAQKEIFVNEALARIDGLLHLKVEGEMDAPPSNPADGEAWIVGASPTGEWAGHSGNIALRQSTNWLFAVPVSGMTAFDSATQQTARYDGQWQRAAAVTLPSGGATVDVEARTAISEILAALSVAGVLPAS
jgi:hypothetical protein